MNKPAVLPVPPQLPLLASVFTILLCTIFGSNTIAVKLSLSGMGVYTTAALRFSLATVALYAWAVLTGQSIRCTRRQVPIVLGLMLIFSLQLSLFYTGLNLTRASRATLIANLLPFLVLVLSHLFIPGERITGRLLAGIALGFMGVVLVFVDRPQIGEQIQIGDVIILMATLVWSCHVVFLKRVIAGFQPLQITLLPMVCSVPVFFVEAWLWDDRMIVHLDSAVVGGLLYQGLIAAAFGFISWNRMLKTYGASTLHSFIFIMPIAGVLLGGLILHEPINSRIWIALALIVSGIIVVNYHPAPPVARRY